MERERMKELLREAIQQLGIVYDNYETEVQDRLKMTDEEYEEIMWN